MPNEIPLLMPKMSMTMETGELLSWEVATGDEVQAGDVVAVVQTDKVDMEVEAPVGGTVARFVAEAGSTIDVGAPIAFISTESESLMDGVLDGPDGSETPAATAGSEPETDADTPEQQADAEGVDGHVSDSDELPSAPSRSGPLPAVPMARRRAAQLRVSLSAIKATGRNGVITVADVESAANASVADAAPAPAAPAPAADAAAEAPTAPTPDAAPTTQAAAKARPPGDQADGDPGFGDALTARRRSVRSAVARTMSHSATVPQFTAFADLDLEALQQARGKLGWTTLLVRALARALGEHPSVLAGWDEKAGAPAQAPSSCAVSLAVDTAVGLLAPVVRDADRIPLPELDETVRDVIARARAGRLTMQDLQGGNTTLSSLGGLGVPSFTSLLTPPQASALSVGEIAAKPVVHNGGLAARLCVTVGLTVDHRAVDGADAAAVLARLRRLCARPDDLIG